MNSLMEKWAWTGICSFLFTIFGVIHFMRVQELDAMTWIGMCIIMAVMVTAIGCLAANIDELHRERCLAEYHRGLLPHKDDRKFLTLELMNVEARLFSKRMARDLNMGKRELLKHMIAEIEKA